MKRLAILLVMLASLTMSSCLVTSLYQFFKAEDKIYDPSLEGNYHDQDSCIWVISANFDKQFMQADKFDSTYNITYYGEEDGNAYLVGTLFILDGKRYVDFYPDNDKPQMTSDFTAFHHIPVHTLARIRSDEKSLMLFWFGEAWLETLFEENRIRIDHQFTDYGDYESNLLTAKTDDLQKFIRKYMNSEEINQQIEDAFISDEDVEDHLAIKLYPYDGPIPEEED